MDIQTNLIRQWASRLLNLLFAPLAIALLANTLTTLISSQKLPGWFWIITIFTLVIAILLYIVVYTYKFEELLIRVARKFRAWKFKRPQVLILDGKIEGDMQETPPNPLHSDRTRTDWQAALEKFRWKVELGPIKRIKNEPIPDIVLNPFGEVYPEADFISHSTNSEIRDYVWRGGIFVNVAGIPFWYRYNPRTGKQETAGRVESITNNTPIWKPLFTDLFPNLTTSEGNPEIVECMQTDEEIKRFGNIAGAGGTQKIEKFRAYSLNAAQLETMLRDNEQQHCIIGYIIYGQGYFLFAGVSIKQNNSSFEKVIAALQGLVNYEAKARKL